MSKSRNAPEPHSPIPSPTLSEDILNAIETIVCVTDGGGNLVYVSPAVKRLLGYEVSEVLGQEWWSRVYAKDQELGNKIRARLGAYARGEMPLISETHTAHGFSASGEERWFVWRDTMGPGNVVIGVGQDVTELRRAQELGEQHMQEFSAVFQNASDGMLILNQGWVYEQVNDAACRIFGIEREQVIGKPHGSAMRSSVQAAEVREQAMARGYYAAQMDFERADGEVRTVRVTVTTNFRPGKHLIILGDISEQRKLQTQLDQAQRLEAVGRLAGGVAHDFNNMLTAIRGYAELLQRNTSDPKHQRYVEGILGATQRAADTTRQLLAFSRKQMLQPKVLDLNEAIQGTVELLKRVIGEDVELILLLCPNVAKVMVDPTQFGQILMNLAINSRDAMPAGGKLIIETRNVELDDAYVLKHIQVEPGRYSMIAVTDTGTGIPPELMTHIFEPFFTTKGQGKGTGLGLAMLYGVVKQSGGYVWVYSEPGQGTTFKIYLPVVGPESETPRKAKKATILVIEDDEAMRTVTTEALDDGGYRVLPARDGTEALTICQRWAERIDLVLTDVMAEGMSGEDLMGYFAVKYPSIAVVHMSGFARTRLEQAHTFFPDAIFLAKPFTMAQLRETVELALQRKAENWRKSIQE